MSARPQQTHRALDIGAQVGRARLDECCPLLVTRHDLGYSWRLRPISTFFGDIALASIPSLSACVARSGLACGAEPASTEAANGSRTRSRFEQIRQHRAVSCMRWQPE